MSRNPSMICFKHCNSSSIFCNKVPTKCPLCKSVISSYILEPFQIPYPCGDATQNSCSVAVRPSRGNFLEDYKPTDDLHIAVTNSLGHIFEFDNCGLIINDFAKWNDCLTLSAIPESWHYHWDSVLLDLSKNSKWKSHNYHETSMNCFNFVIDFFHQLNYGELRFLDKEDFCRLFILPKLQDTLRYVSLYRNLKFEDFYIP